MSDMTLEATAGAPGSSRGMTASAPAGRGYRAPALTLAFTLAFLALTLVPRVSSNPKLLWTFLGVGGVLLAWTGAVWVAGRTRGRTFTVFWTPVKSHYVQASVQFCVYAYWGWYWREVYAQAPLILAQILFLYAVDGLVSWTRGKPWRIGFGALPIIFSTNLFMWFKDDVFVWQFLMVAVGALGKQFINWTRDGQKVHIFNPSAFGLGLFSIVLIAMNWTHYTRGVEIASTLAQPPHIYLEIFLVGLVVQYFFSVTLMTLSAAAALYVMNLIYTQVTGVYQFLDTNIPIAVFLGLHLLMTDPSTTPRTNVGRVIFGSLYGAANFVLYDVLAKIGAPEFYDKLLPVPILNLMVPWIDRFSRTWILGRFTRWEGRFAPKKLNLAHMGIWIALFLTMLLTGSIEAPHKGASLAFWKRAYEEGRHHADWKYLQLVQSTAAGGTMAAPAAYNELGVIHMEGKLAQQDRGAAAHYFSTACELGNSDGCANAARQFLFLREARSDADVARALARVEQDCGQATDGRSCFLLGYAHETGRGRPQDRSRALELYETGCARGQAEACKALARLRTSESALRGNLAGTVATLTRDCEAGDAESCLYLAAIYRGDQGVAPDPARARSLLERACSLGSAPACEALKQLKE